MTTAKRVQRTGALWTVCGAALVFTCVGIGAEPAGGPFAIGCGLLVAGLVTFIAGRIFS